MRPSFTQWRSESVRPKPGMPAVKRVSQRWWYAPVHGELAHRSAIAVQASSTTPPAAAVEKKR